MGLQPQQQPVHQNRDGEGAFDPPYAFDGWMLCQADHVTPLPRVVFPTPSQSRRRRQQVLGERSDVFARCIGSF
jgi:hypothetical protein